VVTSTSLSKQNWLREWVPGELDHFYGDPRGAGGRADQAWAQQNLTTIAPPWAMRIDGSAVSQIMARVPKPNPEWICRDSERTVPASILRPPRQLQ
jgi:hypothetical protein